MANQSTTEILEALASEIGENVYIDVAKWHLYLSDAKLHKVLAEKFYALLSANSVNEDEVLDILKNMSIKIGGGRREIPLIDLLPMQCQVNLIDIVEKYQSRF